MVSTRIFGVAWLASGIGAHLIPRGRKRTWSTQNEVYSWKSLGSANFPNSTISSAQNSTTSSISTTSSEIHTSSSTSLTTVSELPGLVLTASSTDNRSSSQNSGQSQSQSQSQNSSLSSTRNGTSSSSTVTHSVNTSSTITAPGNHTTPICCFLVQDTVSEEWWNQYNYTTFASVVNLTSYTTFITVLPDATSTRVESHVYPTNHSFTTSHRIGLNPISLLDDGAPGPKEVKHANNGTAIVTGGITV